MLRRLVILAAATVTGCSAIPRPDDWSRTDSTLHKAHVAAAVADGVTTIGIRDHETLIENGPIARRFIGEKPDASDIAAYTAASIVGTYWIATKLPPKWRRVWLALMSADRTYGVAIKCGNGLC